MNKIESHVARIGSSYYTGIRAGTRRERFLDIWMVVVENRIFARSWGFAEKSWYNTFLIDDIGSLKTGEFIVQIKAIIPNDLHALTYKINEAYLNKYNHGDRTYYAERIILQEHIDKTMEFILITP